MSRSLVYDLPTRIFHWLFASLFVISFVIAKTIDDESVTFSYHMIAGMTLSFLVVLRIIWGLIGTKHAKFSGFALNPADLIGYASGFFSGSKRRWAGHNPASSWAAVIMLTLALCLGITGYLMATGPENRDIKEIHEVIATLFLIVALTHVVGIIVHTLRHRELIGLSMVDGKKDNLGSGQTIGDPKTLVGIIGLSIVLAWATTLLVQFDPSTRSLTLFGTHLQLGENDEEKEHRDNADHQGEHSDESNEY